MARRRRLSATLATLLAACGAPKQPATFEQNAVDPKRGPAAEAAAALARDALHHDRFARGTLYTWTTLDQIDELRRTGQLLVREESPLHGASYLDQVLYLLANRGDAIAKLLYTSTYAKMRFAWHAPWATLAGWPGEVYGDHLIRITLKPDAIILAISTTTAVFEARNLLNEVVPLANVLARPEKIAAIYFVSDVAAKLAPGLPKPTASFREFAVCNESMIESWEVGTPEIAKLLADEAKALEVLAKHLDTLDEPPKLGVTETWPRAIANASPAVAYGSALALDSPLYKLDKSVLRGIAQRLRDAPKPTAFGRQTATTFTPGPARKPPRIVQRYNPTYASFARLPHPTAAKPNKP